MGVTSSHRPASITHPPHLSIPELCGWGEIFYVGPSTRTHVGQRQWERHPKASSCTDSPLCSPKKTSLNFLRGFPKSPPAVMVADNRLNSDYFLFLFLLFVFFSLPCYVLIGPASAPLLGAQGDPPLLTEWWECSSASSCHSTGLVRMRDPTSFNSHRFFLSKF